MNKAILGLLVAMAVTPAMARDNGQWENSDPVTKEWYRTLMRPDQPNMSCCGEADAYWADVVRVKEVELPDGTKAKKVFAVVTDDRDDKPLGRPHIPVGTEIEIPPEKYKFDAGNPTGHAILFISSSRFTYCYVQGTGG